MPQEPPRASISVNVSNRKGKKEPSKQEGSRKNLRKEEKKRPGGYLLSHG
jgi:hypothetical protein